MTREISLLVSHGWNSSRTAGDEDSDSSGSSSSDSSEVLAVPALRKVSGFSLHKWGYRTPKMDGL